MIKRLSTGLILCLFIFSAKAQENCSSYYPMVQGASYSYNLYSKKNKLEGTTSYIVSDVKNDRGNTYASMKMKYEDAKGKNTFESDYNITCTGDGIKIDYKSLFPSQMQKQYEEMGLEMEITGTDLEIPNNLSVGKELSDANVDVSMDMSGMSMKIEVNTTDRKVVGKESVTTPAGTFDCYIISANTSSKVMMTKQQIKDKLWLSEGVGMVKQETYNNNGKLMSSMVLTSHSK
ncbi:hypothetical protein [Flagellimonas meridianipacifica]|uniref:DUF3108 domain-containing protein n=1 Tax=Flagellimonas meridianipacifica TaxID=1080225 RepID=A0A2T0MEL4_9FLAO|nr:hypothetical protein [Allomuricauda pacifica]PRX56019.1 hypothetical protein CLV81_0007 [Allomuricauda pacifica]